MDRLFRFFAIAECRAHDASSPQVRSQATVSCSQPGYRLGKPGGLEYGRLRDIIPAECHHRFLMMQIEKTMGRQHQRVDWP